VHRRFSMKLESHLAISACVRIFPSLLQVLSRQWLLLTVWPKRMGQEAGVPLDFRRYCSLTVMQITEKAERRGRLILCCAVLSNTLRWLRS
jgi:hypothetical protein